MELHDIYGQNVRDTFPTADVIINAESKESITKSLSRFIEILFRHPTHTPTIDEYGMYFAKAAALRSADLSRQVGAVIMSQEGVIISVGCNEVPKGGGGLYWEGDQHDSRDFRIGYDSSVSIKHEILGDILKRLKHGGWLSKEKKGRQIDQLVKEALLGGDNPLLSGAQFMDVLEFGRIVHAEMAALSDSARFGLSVNGATLYCTTFPCHICARHIVASGIDRVVYIEPYPKSMAAKLYPDSITVDEEKKSKGKTVMFDSFVGVSPTYYSEYFESYTYERKKKSGEVIGWNPSEAQPRVNRFLLAYIDMEMGVVSALDKEMKRNGLTTNIN